MTTLAIVFMLGTLAGVSVLAGWCYYRVMRAPREGRTSEDQDPVRKQ